MIEDVAQSSMLAHEAADWDAALRRVRKALQKEGARSNSYLRRLAAECSFSLGDWPTALRYAQEAATLAREEMGGGLTRSLCLEADARLCLCDPLKAWDLYTAAGAAPSSHPLPRYYRGQALLLLARLLDVYASEQLRDEPMDARSDAFAWGAARW